MKISDTYIAGDHLLNGSINAAMKSGRISWFDYYGSKSKSKERRCYYL
jgi:hypothetical protein